jgi:curli biogenesis system outer membrane secretion channel CsgG
MSIVAHLRRAVARPALAAVATLTLLAPAASRAQEPASGRDDRPTVAVLYFTNGALVGNADYAPLSKGMAEMLITELASNPRVRVVERDRLQQLLQEQNLGSGDRVDKETAIRLGRILGAHHLLMGAFVIDPRQNMRIDVRSVNTETSQIEYVESITGKADRMLAMVSELGLKVNTGLKLPPMPVRVNPAVAPASSPNQLRATMLLSRALERQDRGDTAGAIALYKQALEANPEFTRAKVLLASLEK